MERVKHTRNTRTRTGLHTDTWGTAWPNTNTNTVWVCWAGLQSDRFIIYFLICISTVIQYVAVCMLHTVWNQTCIGHDTPQHAMCAIHHNWSAPSLFAPCICHIYDEYHDSMHPSCVCVCVCVCMLRPQLRYWPNQEHKWASGLFHVSMQHRIIKWMWCGAEIG